MTDVSHATPGVPAVAIIVSRYNASVTDRLLDAARAEYAARGGDPTGLTVVDAPGAFELPTLSLAAARSLPVEGVLAIGCVIKGETSHDRVIADAVASGLVGVTLATGIPVALGVLTTDTPEQALDRAGGRHGNKGKESMAALLDTIAAARALKARVAPATPSAPAPRPDKARRSAAPAKPPKAAKVAKRSGRRS